MSDKIEHFGEKDNLPDKANRQLPTGELSQDMLEMLESETDTFEAEDQFNFSDLLDPEDLEVFDGYTPEEKVKIFTALIESPEVQSDVYRVQQLKLLFQIVSEINAEFMDPKTRTMRLRKWYENWSNFITGEERFSGRYTKEFENLLKSDLEQFISTDMPRISEEVILGEKTVAQAIKEHPLLKSIVESYGLDFSPAQSEADIRRQTITTVDFLRSIKHYKAASDLIESSMEAMSEEKAKYMRAYQAVYDVQTAPFNDPEESKKRFEVQNALPTDLQNSGYELFLQRAELDKKIDGKRAKNMDFMKKNGMTEEQIAVYFDALKEELFSIKLSQYAAEKLDESKIPSEQIKLWNKYKEINDPKGEWFEFKDESIDKLIDTVVVNLPLIIGSGGMAAAIREGLSAGTKYLIGRVAARALIRGSGKYTAEELVLVVAIK